MTKKKKKTSGGKEVKKLSKEDREFIRLHREARAFTRELRREAKKDPEKTVIKLLKAFEEAKASLSSSKQEVV